MNAHNLQGPADTTFLLPSHTVLHVHVNPTLTAHLPCTLKLWFRHTETRKTSLSLQWMDKIPWICIAQSSKGSRSAGMDACMYHHSQTASSHLPPGSAVDERTEPQNAALVALEIHVPGTPQLCCQCQLFVCFWMARSMMENYSEDGCDDQLGLRRWQKFRYW